MKTISTLLTSLVFTSSVFAADIRSSASLTVKTEEKQNIVVVVDGNRFDLGTNSIMISDLDACAHDVVVYQEKKDNPYNYFQKAYDVIFNSSIELKPRTNLQIHIDDCGIITMNEIRSRTPKMGDSWSNHGSFDNGYSEHAAFSSAMNYNEFNRVIWAIGKEGSDLNRMKSAEQIIKTNFLTVDEVKQMMQLFCTDDYKLEIARTAYVKTVDPENFFQLSNLLHSENSKGEFARCLKEQ